MIVELIVKAFGKYSYMAAGITETIKGLLAFVSSPVFGRLSDKIGPTPMVSMLNICQIISLVSRQEVLYFGHCSGFYLPRNSYDNNKQYVHIFYRARTFRFLHRYIRSNLRIHF